MLITRETDYALRILRALGEDQLEKTADLSRQECIPKQFTYKILKKLERAGMVEVRPGLGGGCRRIGDLKQHHLLNLMEAMGDCVMVNACTKSGYECSWQQTHGHCQTHCRLLQIQSHIEEELRTVTLDQLCAVPQADRKSGPKKSVKRKKKEESET